MSSSDAAALSLLCASEDAGPFVPGPSTEAWGLPGPELVFGPPPYRSLGGARSRVDARDALLDALRYLPSHETA